MSDSEWAARERRTGIYQESKKMQVHYSSKKMDWQTPDEFLDIVREFAPIQLDPCTSPENPVGARVWMTPRENGLLQNWDEFQSWSDAITYMNPPYGRQIGKWTYKASLEAQKGVEIIALVPARTDTKWFQEADFTAVCFWRGRLRFKGAPHPAPFPSAVLYWGDRPERFMDVFEPYGLVYLA